MFNIQSCSFGKAPIVKGDRFSQGQCPHTDIERYHIKAVPYSLVVGSVKPRKNQCEAPKNLNFRERVKW